MRHLFVIAAIVFAGCAAETDVSESQHGVSTSNRIGLNRIALNRIALNRIALNRIALNRIALNRLSIDSFSTSGLIDSDPDLLDYVISCAFPPDVEVVGTNSAGETLTFHGGIGLAPYWEIRRLTTREQRWMSACLLARVSNSGTPLLISLRGPSEALTVTTEEANDFPLEEGAYFGDVFSDNQRFYACRGADLYAGNLGVMATFRACAQPVASGETTVCGMTYAGECDAFNDERSCTYREGDYYRRCHSTPSNNGKWHDEGLESRFEQVVTVYVSTTPLFPQ